MQVMDGQNRIHAEQNKGQFNVLTASAELEANQLVTHANNSGAAMVIKLPPVAEAAGKIYSIYTVAIAGASGVDVIDRGDALYSATEGSTAIDVSSAVAIDTAGDFLCMYSNGISWICLGFNIA